MVTVEKTSNGVTVKVTKNDEYGWDVNIDDNGVPFEGAYTDGDKMFEDILPYIEKMNPIHRSLFLANDMKKVM